MIGISKRLLNLQIIRKSKYIFFLKLKQEQIVSCFFRSPLWKFILTTKLHPTLPPVLLQISFFKMSESNKKDEKLAELLVKADDHFAKREFKEIISLLEEHVEMENDDLIWRLARAIYEVEKLNSNKQEQIKAFEYAFSLLEKALVINEQNGNVHKWYVIVYNTILEHRGVKEKINKGELLKSHLESAIKYLPQDPTSCHLLGVWYYSVADLTWYERKIASLIYATPPSGTYEEALQYFEKAEEIKPGFYNKNFLMLGECYLKANQKDKARDVLIKARDYVVLDAEDKKIQDKAISLLKSHKLL